jgi:peptide/nickel transport system permease protein
MLGLHATPEEVIEMRHILGFDRPLHVQYLDFVGKVLTEGSFGESIRHHREASHLVLERLPATLELTFASMLFAILIGIPVGVLAANYRNSWIDSLVMGMSLLGQAIPSFWLGILMILLLGVQLKWLPISGRGDWQQLIMPAIATGTFALAFIARITRSVMLEQLSQDYIRTARAKGQIHHKVLYFHALRNASIPIVTLIGLQFGSLLGGAIIIEQVFGWPGVGRFALQAVSNRDFPVVQATVFMVAFSFGIINFLTDMLYTAIDPRIRYS